MSFFDDEETHLSQLASDPVNPTAPRPPAEGGTDFRRAFARARQPQPNTSSILAAESEPAAAAVPPRNSGRSKIFNDPIHGTFRLGPECIEVIDSRQFQRLRRLKQLGLAYQVFPGASHNRFEHSLGVAHLAYRLGSHLWNFQRDELDMDRRDLRVVELAGACHDLGHGPFSHVFDRELLRRKGITNWEHEDMSGLMLSAIIDEKHIDSLPEDDIKRVQRMITASHDGGGVGDFGGKRWLYEIVANGRNGIDVDKHDYLARDSMYCGVKISCDFNRIMQFTKVIGDEICYKYSEYMNLFELFHSRASMHRQVYTHRKCKAVEFMLVDALLEADSVLHLTDRIWDANQFVHLDDGILELVENCGGMLGPLLHVDEEQEKALEAARAVISRLRRRDLYKFCSEALVPQELVDRGQWRLPSEQDIVNCYTGSDVQLRPEDVILTEVKIDHSMASKNPLDHTSFFDDLYCSHKRHLRPEQISGMVPSCFQEKTLRIYSRNSRPEYVAAAHQAFESWTKRRFGSTYCTSTPLKVRPLEDAPPRLQMTLAAAMAGGAVAEAAGAAAAAGGAKRQRELFPPAGAGDDTSPTPQLRTKQRRQVEQSL